MDSNLVLSKGFNDLVFEHRHKAYGAFQLRRQYSNNVMWALFLAIVISTGAVLLSFFLNDENNRALPPEENTVILISDIGHPSVTPPKPEIPEKKITPKQNVAAKGDVNSDQLKTPQITNNMVNPPSNADAGKRKDGEEGGLGGGTEKKNDCINCIPVDTVHLEQKPRLVEISSDPPTNPLLDQYLMENLKYPAMCREGGVEGVVFVEFIVDTRGDVRNLKIIKGAHPLMNKEVMRVMSKMPRWNPGKDNGELVEYIYRKPVRFSLMK
ncbi:MAG: hypothetical protein Fur0041_04110 [Bacteroidia bacterium]